MTDPRMPRNTFAVTPGRCGSCRFLEAHELPLRTLYFCRRFMLEMNREQKDGVRDCGGWEYSRPLATAERRDRARVNNLFGELLKAEDRLFAALRDALSHYGIDLKTAMLLTNPALATTEKLNWIDELEGEESDYPIEQLLSELRMLGHEDLAALIDNFLQRLPDRIIQAELPAAINPDEPILQAEEEPPANPHE